MEGLLDTFSDLASFSLANEFVDSNNVPLVESLPSNLSLFNSEYINYIYIGIFILVIIVGGLIYKFNYVQRKIENNDSNNYNSNCFDGICPR